jgi:hypothetical protein
MQEAGTTALPKAHAKAKRAGKDSSALIFLLPNPESLHLTRYTRNYSISFSY